MAEKFNILISIHFFLCDFCHMKSQVFFFFNVWKNPSPLKGHYLVFWFYRFFFTFSNMSYLKFIRWIMYPFPWGKFWYFLKICWLICLFNRCYFVGQVFPLQSFFLSVLTFCQNALIFCQMNNRIITSSWLGNKPNKLFWDELTYLRYSDF